MSTDPIHNEDIIYEGHPCWRAILAFYVWGLVITAVIAVIIHLVGDTTIAVFFFLIGVAVTVLVGFVRRIFTTYTISDQRLRIRRGIITRNIQEARISRVQNVNIRQGVLERMLRVGTVDFDTAGKEDSDFLFVGVDNPQAIVAALDRAHEEFEREHSDNRYGADGL